MLHVLHHLVVLEEVHVRERVLLRVDGPRFECAVDAAAVHGNRFGAERTGHVVEHLPVGHAQLEADEIRRHANRTSSPGDLPHPVVERADGEADDPFRGHLFAQIGAERSIDRLVRLLGGAERKRHLLDVGRGHDVAEDAAHQREELHLAGRRAASAPRDRSRDSCCSRGRPASRRVRLIPCGPRPTSPAGVGAAGCRPPGCGTARTGSRGAVWPRVKIVNDPTVAAVRKDRRLSSRLAFLFLVVVRYVLLADNGYFTLT